MSDPNTLLPSTEATPNEGSGVFARKYRPDSFARLIGQETSVSMLQNALKQDKVAQAIVFSGVRGTGKTTLARIVAKGLNCLSFDKPTAEPCGHCSSCTEIAAGNSLDVQEIDAASHTGVDHIRDLIGSLSYRPISRFKVYILDEVHMLSTSAFNALLKTLEEPPAHVRFIFATTELRKIPATVLSRTQRFRLKRVEVQTLVDFLQTVVANEQKQAEEEALYCIARASEGSVRDALSILDQFLSSKDTLTEIDVRDQLSLGDRQAVVALLQALFETDGAKLLSLWDQQDALGVDGHAMVQDILFLCHQISRFKVMQCDDALLSEAERVFIRETAHNISMPMLARLWQLMLQGAKEVKVAINPKTAFEMLLIRALYLSELPTPEQILTACEKSEISTKHHKPSPNTKVQEQGNSEQNSSPPAFVATSVATDSIDDPSEPPLPAPPLPSQAVSSLPIVVKDFPALVRLLDDHAEGMLASILRMDARLEKFSQGHLSLYVKDKQKLQPLKKALQEITHVNWTVEILDTPDQCALTLQEQEANIQLQKLEAAKSDSTVMSVKQLFPDTDVARLISHEAKE